MVSAPSSGEDDKAGAASVCSVHCTPTIDASHACCAFTHTHNDALLLLCLLVHVHPNYNILVHMRTTVLLVANTSVQSATLAAAQRTNALRNSASWMARQRSTSAARSALAHATRSACRSAACFFYAHKGSRTECDARGNVALTIDSTRLAASHLRLARVLRQLLEQLRVIALHCLHATQCALHIQ